jgi:hypothetical protein
LTPEKVVEKSYFIQNKFIFIDLSQVDMTMDSVLETMQDYRDVEEALREGFRSLPAGDSVEEAELESELNELIREAAAEEEEKKREADIGQPIAGERAIYLLF